MKKRIQFLIVILAIMGMTGCRYNWILPEEDVDPNPDGDPISFATQVQPIFDNKCIGCHNTGGTLPDLTAGKSYNQIVPGYVNTATPAESKVYKTPTAATAWHSRKYSSNEAAIVLTWIQEGAKNN